MATGNIRDLYDKNNFILPITVEDTQVRLQNVELVLKHTLSPNDVVTTYVQSKNLKIKTLTDIHTLCFSTNQEALDALTLLQLALDQVKNNISIGPGGGISGLLGTPTDGFYGLLYPSLAGVAAGDRVEDAFDKVTTFLERFVPAPPPNLSAITLSIPSLYSALQENTGTTHNEITSNPVETISATNFYDGKTGNLSAIINNVAAGSIALTIGDDTGLTNNNLTITNDVDFYLGDSTKENFWWSLSADIITSAPNLLALGLNNVSMTHTTTGISSTELYLDDPNTPLISNPNITTTSLGTYISGVPFLVENDPVVATFNIDQVISEYYNISKVGELTGTSIANNIYQPIIAPSKGSTVNVSISTLVLNNIFEPGAAYSLNGYSSNNILGTLNVVSNLNIDSLSDETPRLLSGIGQFPVAYGGAYDSSASILPLEELQMINGQYQFPSAISYASFNPSGPDYSSITGGSYLDMRWVTFQPIIITNEVGVTIDFNNASNFDATAIMTNYELQIKVEGQTGWLDGNAAYPGVGVPVVDGDPSLVIGSSNSTTKRITFSVARTGTVSIRIGIPTGSIKAFGGINVTV